MKETISNSVNKIRTERNVTQEMLAREVDVSRQTISSIEKGNYIPSVLLAIKLAKFFEVSVEKLFTITYEK